MVVVTEVMMMVVVVVVVMVVVTVVVVVVMVVDAFDTILSGDQRMVALFVFVPLSPFVQCNMQCSSALSDIVVIDQYNQHSSFLPDFVFRHIFALTSIYMSFGINTCMRCVDAFDSPKNWVT